MMESSQPSLDYIDYVLFILVLLISFLIGLYYGMLSKVKQDTPEEYFLGNRNMGVFPVSISLLVTFISGASIIGLTVDVYAHGTHQWQYVFTCFIMLIATWYIFLPIFYELQLPSTFAYLKLRFGRQTQLLASFMFFCVATLSASICIYIPALVLNQTSGISPAITMIILGLVCIFYTAIGGFRAVIWVDLFQSSLIVACCIAIIVIGLKLVGGVNEVWEASKRGERLILFNFNPDPTIRLTTWIIIFGHSFQMIQFGFSQMTIQRLLSIPSLTKARGVMFIFCIGFLCSIGFSLAIALILYTYYEQCDPFKSGLISNIDQLVTHFVTEIHEHFPGLPGIFIAGIVAGSLSTISSFLNSITLCLFEDFILPFLPEMSHKKTCNIIKLLAFILGSIQIALAFVIGKIGTIFVIVQTVLGLTGGALIGLFTMGMLLPKANQIGGIAGAISSLIGVGIIIFGSLSKKAQASLPMRTDGCLHNITNFVNRALPTEINDTEDDVPWIFRISFMYYSTIGCVLVYLIGYPVSLLTGGINVKDQRLLAPFIRKKASNKLPQNVEELRPISDQI
ncbi:sodium-coupled monocarboxylate transporter 1-like [Phlebotomus papatasi]|uniref:sodium-coupled monocarboxylate transporter 1-like n=1 Tax=Phlebotomus papatasi TaxID=29031 RepID=UPI00248358B3|nr:sodium-coupled monocarboxylate transporter 1-like [Phlebotomus papatasi]